MNPLPYLRRCVNEIIDEPAGVPLLALVIVLVYLLCGCVTTGTTTGLAPSIEFLRDHGCVPDHGVRLVIDGAEYQLADVEERMRLSVTAGAHRIVHYVGSYEMRRWTVTVSGRTYITLPCLNGQSRARQKREEMTR